MTYTATSVRQYNTIYMAHDLTSCCYGLHFRHWGNVILGSSLSQLTSNHRVNLRLSLEYGKLSWKNENLPIKCENTSGGISEFQEKVNLVGIITTNSGHLILLRITACIVS